MAGGAVLKTAEEWHGSGYITLVTIREIQRDALEHAAKIADEEQSSWEHRTGPDGVEASRSLAKFIRAAKP